MVFRSFTICSSILLILGCATTHRGPVVESADKSILLSAHRNADLSDKYYLFYEYTLENKSSDWKQIQIVDVDFADENTEILTGEKLAAWIEGAELKFKKSQYNRDLVLGSMAAAGAAVALTSNNNSAQAAGAAALAGATAVSATANISSARGKASSGSKSATGSVNVPHSHVFVPSRIAPESYIKRWIVIRAPKHLTENPEETALNKRNSSRYSKSKLISKAKVDNKEEIVFTLEVPSVAKKLTSSP